MNPSEFADEWKQFCVNFPSCDTLEMKFAFYAGADSVIHFLMETNNGNPHTDIEEKIKQLSRGQA